MNEERDVIGEVIAEDNARAMPPSVAQFIEERAGLACAELEVVATIESLDENTAYIESRSKRINTHNAIYNDSLVFKSDADAAIAQRDARIADLDSERAEQWRLRREAEADRDTKAAVIAELKDELAALKARKSGVMDERAAFEAFDYPDRCFRLRREGERYIYGTTERELAAFRAGAAWQASAALSAPSHGERVREQQWQLIHDTLRNYRMGTLSDGEGGGYPLIDAMTADGQSVSRGIEECTYLADAIWNVLAAAPSAGSQEPGE